MYMTINKILLMWWLSFVLIVKSSTVNNEQLNVTILYESLCPDSVRFMAQQLGTIYDTIKDYINITLVPFGKSYSVGGGAQFYCQHGPSECLGNRQHSCVFHQTTNQEAHVKFSVCQMTSEDKLNVNKCSQAVGLSNDIDGCMGTVLGTQLQLKAEHITNAYAPSFIPTIIYDGIFDQQLQDSSLRNFSKTVCYVLHKHGDHAAYNMICQ